MINNCNKIRFVALVVLMLLGTISVWAEGIGFIGNSRSSVIKFHGWSDVGNTSVVTEENPEINAYPPRFYNEGGTILGTGDVKRLVYADLFGYSGIRVVGTPEKQIRFLFNRQTDNENMTANGIVEVVEKIPANGILELIFSANETLRNLEYYHLNAIKIFWGSTNNNTFISSVKAIEEPMFYAYNGVGNGSAITNPYPSISEFTPQSYAAGATVLGTGDVNRLCYADLTNCNGIRIKGTPNQNVRLLFNRQTDANDNTNGMVEVNLPINEHGVLEVDFKDNALLKDLPYYHLNAIKIPYGQASTQISEIKVFNRSYYFKGKDVQARQVYSMSYRVPLNSQREFTFRQSRKWSDGAVRKYNWAMSIFDHILEGGGCRELLYMDCSPTAYGRDGHDEQDISGNVDVTDIYKVGTKNDDGINVLTPLTEEYWNEFLIDMFNDAEVSLKVSNYDGIVRVYAVMKRTFTENGQTIARTYVYPYQYNKYQGAADDIYVCLTEDHTWIWDLVAHPAVQVTKLDYTPEYSGTSTHEQNCYVTMYTDEGYLLPRYTKTGIGDNITYLATPSWGWEFEKWGSMGSENPRVITIGSHESHYGDNGACTPTATFKANSNMDLNLATNRIFFLDFEGMSDNDLLSGEGAPVNEPTADEQGKFYNYGGKGRILKDDKFGNYYQNLAVEPDEYTESKAENFLRRILTNEEQAQFGKINDAPEGQRAATIGFWVNGSVAVDYELPLERGSMFCIFSNERFRKADAGNIEPGQEPRFMFDISCNGWAYSYMPNSYYKTDSVGNYILDEHNNKIKVDYVNKFFYGETQNLVDNPKQSLFGVNNYVHTQDQRQHKFYDDKRWHYVTYVATEDLKKITMYIDGEKTGEIDTRTLGEDMQFFHPDGNYPGRAWYLRNIVLGGFTPHGLFFEKQYYQDAALAYDDISIYSVALSQAQIKDIIKAKGYSTTPTEWHFASALKSEGEAKKVELSSDVWVAKGEGIYATKVKFGTGTRDMKRCASLTSGGKTLYTTEGLTFWGEAGNILVDQKNGLIGLKRGTMITVPNVPRGASVYFVVKSEDREKYMLDHFDIYPNPGTSFYTRGVSRYGGEGKEDFYMLTTLRYVSTGSNGFEIYVHTPKKVRDGENDHTNNNNNNILWFSDVIVSPYCLSFAKINTAMNNYNDIETIDYIDVTYDANGNVTATDSYGQTIANYMSSNGKTNFPNIIIQKARLDEAAVGYLANTEALSNYAKGNAYGNPYIRFSSSAPHVATVDQNGNVTIKGIAGYATIKAELVFDNIHDGCISTAYQIRVTKAPKTRHAEENSTYDIAYKQIVKANDGSDAITMSLGGWAYNDNTYAGTEGDDVDNNGSAVDSWSKGFVIDERNDVTPVDGFNTYSQGSQNAKSESYGNDDGRYIPTTQVVRNVTPWTLPCRGSYLKFDAEKPGVLTVYVLQNGNLDKSNINNDYSDQIHWRPVYITNERGVCVPRVQYDTNSKISENDNFFKEGRRRAQFIEEEEGTYNQRLKNALLGLKNSNYDRFKLLLSRWENQGWKQKVIETGDGGYMIMSKGIVRYSFNVVPGQTYYVFSNDTKIGYAGYNFEEGKILFDNARLDYDVNPMYGAAVTTTPVVYKDELNYNPKLPEGINNMFSVPVEIQRSFKANTWSSICLPFSMNRKQLEENFGEGTSVVLLKQVINQGYKKGRVELIWHVNQDIIAGYPYFILPTKNVTKIKFNAPFRKDQDRYLETPYLAVGSNGKSFEHKSGYTYYDEYPYVFEGNFKDEEIPAGSYVMSNSGTLARVKNPVTAKPFRAYIRCIDVANAKPLTTMSFSESEGETTSIEELLQDNGIILESSDVYGVNGVKVRSNTHSLEGLSKGIYVVNGKKYVVK